VRGLGRWLGVGVGLVLGLACATEPATPSSEPGAGAQTGVVAPALGLAEDQAPASPDATTTLLHPVGFREGHIALAYASASASDGASRAYALIDGEPIALVAGQAPVREPSHARGLLPDKAYFAGTHELLAFGGQLPGSGDSTAPGLGAWLVYAEHSDHAASAYFSYAWTDEGWQPRAAVRERGGARSAGLRVETHTAALVVSEGALLGLRRPTLRSDLWEFGDDDPSLGAALARAGGALAKAPRGFEVLAGPPPTALPSLATGWDARDAISIPDGTLVALAFRHRSSLDGDDGPARIATWAPGARTAQLVELPGLPEASALELDLHLGHWDSSSGQDQSGALVLVGGLRDLPGPIDEPYLAAREHDGTWVEIPLALPGVHERVSAATATPSGELWIVTGARNYASEAPCPCLWRRPAGSEIWEPVTLGPFTGSSGAEFRDDQPRWAHVLPEQRWIEIPAANTPPLYPAARELAWADGAIWVTAELGRAYPSAEPVLGDPRMVLYASVALPAGVAATELPATDQLYDQRVAQRVAQTPAIKPGSDTCQTFNVVLVDDPDGAGRELANDLLEQLPALAAAATVEAEDRWASASMIYVGRELDPITRPSQLVMEASAWSPRSADALADALVGILGRRPALDCRPRAMIRAIESLR
jgi:hypothetical protein